MVNQHNFAVCRYCGESDPFELTVCTRFVNGKAETIEVCFNCYWIDKFRSETKEDGKILPESNSGRLQFPQPGLSDSGKTTQHSARARLQGSMAYLAGNKKTRKRQ